MTVPPIGSDRTLAGDQAHDALDLLLALSEEWCNGCRQPRSEWGPVCPGMTQGDWTHFHSRKFWLRAFGIARAAEAEIARLERERDDWRTTARAESDGVMRWHDRAERAEAEVARFRAMEPFATPLPAYVRLQERAEAAEAEIARLAEQGRIAAKRYGEEHEKRVATEAEIARLTAEKQDWATKGFLGPDDARALKAEVARLRDGLRQFFEEYDGPHGEYAPSDKTEALLRALLAEDGAALTAGEPPREREGTDPGTLGVRQRGTAVPPLSDSPAASAEAEVARLRDGLRRTLRDHFGWDEESLAELDALLAEDGADR